MKTRQKIKVLDKIVADTNHKALIEKLLKSEEPSIRWKTRVNVLGEDPDSAAMRKLESEIQNTPRVKALLQKVNNNGHLKANVFAKWQGAQWVLMTLADIGYPRGEKRSCCQQWMTSIEHG